MLILKYLSASIEMFTLVVLNKGFGILFISTFCKSVAVLQQFVFVPL